ncbi:hypothetical protein GYMLUDRAFT_1027483 [Collybiopsis luxurians FD-317 M1]|nr:hypothetical protein GYMLUDRAFT_1027483 [Collybiopsis luxurians FD-317 M1]
MDASNSLLSPRVDNKIFLSGCVGFSFAAITTIVRLILRIRYFGWDDALAGMALASLTVAAVAGIRFSQIDASSTIPQNSRVALYYTLEVIFDVTIWIARLSILFTVIRLGWYRKQLYTAAGCFVLVMLFLVAQVFWVCEARNRQDHWKEDPSPMCIGVASITITQVVSTCVSKLVISGSFQYSDCDFIIFS